MPEDRKPLRYLALGDSYTIGTGASSERRSFPTLVARKLSTATGRLVAVSNPAVNGFTSRDLIRRELPLLETVRPQFVTVLIGANDVVQKRGLDVYGQDLETIYDAVAAQGLPWGRVYGISVPDWSITPAATAFGTPSELRAGIDAANSVAAAACAARGFGWIDIGELSRSGAGRSGWLSADRLHPADDQYAAWADAVWRVVGDPWTAAAEVRGSQ